MGAIFRRGGGGIGQYNIWPAVHSYWRERWDEVAFWGPSACLLNVCCWAKLVHWIAEVRSSELMVSEFHFLTAAHKPRSHKCAVLMGRSTLWSHQLWGLQGIFQAQHPQTAGLCLSRNARLPGHQAAPQSLSVLPPAEVFVCRHALRVWVWVLLHFHLDIRWKQFYVAL